MDAYIQYFLFITLPVEYLKKMIEDYENRTDYNSVTACVFNTSM